MDMADLAEQLEQPTVRLHALHEALRLGHGDEASAAIEEAAVLIDGPLAGAYAVHARGVANEDPKLLEESADIFEDLGLPLLAAEAAVQAGVALRQAGLLAPAQTVLMRATRLAQRCEGVRTPILELAAEPASLTRREREIARLAAKGMSNAEIASHLVVSVRTVEGHLYNAYTKLGVTDRTALGAVVA
jgi:DNA-binding CsgD family transcriptional regulator